MPLSPKPPSGGSWSVTRLIPCSVPSGLNDSQGSEARSKRPPVQTVSAGTATWVHVNPPSTLADDTFPFEPPFE